MTELLQAVLTDVSARDGQSLSGVAASAPDQFAPWGTDGL